MNQEIILDALQKMGEGSFEKTCISLLENMGLSMEHHRIRNGVIEAEGTKKKEEGSKRYKIMFHQSNEEVSASHLQRLADMRLRDDEEVIFFTTGNFSEEAEEYGDEMGIGMVDGASISLLLEKHKMVADIIRPEDSVVVDDSPRFLPSVADLHDFMESGTEYFEKKNYKKALSRFEKALELKPNYAPAWRMKAKCLFDMESDEEALEVYKHALTMDVNNPEMWLEFAEILYSLGLHKDELMAYDRALELNKKFSRAWNNKGATLFEMNEIDRAIQCFEKAVEFSPSMEDTWHNMGLVYKKKGDYQEALRCYYKSLAIDSLYLEARISLINLLLEMERYEEANDQCRVGLQSEKKDERLWYLTALSFKGLGLYNKAVYCAAEALELNPSSETLRRLKADLSFLLDRYGDDVPAEPLFGVSWGSSPVEDEEEASVDEEGADDTVEDAGDRGNVDSVEIVETKTVEDDAVEPETVESNDPEPIESVDIEETPVEEFIEPVVHEIESEEEAEEVPVEEDNIPEDEDFLGDVVQEETGLEIESEEDDLGEESVTYEFLPPISALVEEPVEAKDGEKTEEPDEPAEKQEEPGVMGVFLKEVDNILQKAETNLPEEDETAETQKDEEYVLPTDFNELVKIARLSMMLGKSSLALDACERALSIDEKDDVVWTLRGNALYHLDRIDGAVESYSTALRKNPRSIPAMLNREAAFYKGRYVEEQVHACTRITELIPGRWDGWTLKACGLMDQEEYTESVENFEQAISLQNDLCMVQNLQALALFLSGEENEALSRFTEMVSAIQGSATAWCNRGIALFSTGDNEQALEAFNRVVRISPSSSVAWNNMGVVLYALDKKEEAKEAFDTAISKNQGSSYAWCNRGIASYEDGNVDEALSHLRNAVDMDEEDHYAWYSLGNALLKDDERRGAEEAFSRALRLAPTTFRYQKALARISKESIQDESLKSRRNRSTKQPPETGEETKVEDYGERNASKEKVYENGETITPAVRRGVGPVKENVTEDATEGFTEDATEDATEEKVVEDEESVVDVEDVSLSSIAVDDRTEEWVEETDDKKDEEGTGLGFFLEPISTGPPPPPADDGNSCPRCGIELSGREPICPLCGMELT